MKDFLNESKLKSNIFLFVLLGVLLIVLGWLGNSIYQDYKTIPQTSQSTQISNISQCSNMSLKNTSYCLRDYVSTFYNYTVRTDIPRTEEDIRLNGGDCYDYANLYEGYAKELGFYGYHESISVTKDINHGFAVISDKEGYCILDQTDYPKCNYYGIWEKYYY